MNKEKCPIHKWEAKYIYCGKLEHSDGRSEYRFQCKNCADDMKSHKANGEPFIVISEKDGYHFIRVFTTEPCMYGFAMEGHHVEAKEDS